MQSARSIRFLFGVRFAAGHAGKMKQNCNARTIVLLQMKDGTCGGCIILPVEQLFPYSRHEHRYAC